MAGVDFTDVEPEPWMDTETALASPGEGEWEAPAGDPEPEEPPAAPSDEVIEQANRMAGQRELQIRQELAKYGLDLAQDGSPVIRDPGRFGQWAEPLTQMRRVDTAAQQPRPQPEPESVRAPKEEFWEMDEEKLGQIVEQRASKLLDPLVEKLSRAEAALARRVVDEASRSVEAALREYAPDSVHIARHPEFAERFHQAVKNLDPELLDNPQVIASMALGTVAFMNPKDMPKRETEGSLADAARAAASRATPGVGNYGPGGSSTTREGYDPNDALRIRFFEHFLGGTDMAEQRALEATDKYGDHTITAYQQTLKRLRKTK